MRRAAGQQARTSGPGPHRTAKTVSRLVQATTARIAISFGVGMCLHSKITGFLQSASRAGRVVHRCNIISLHCPSQAHPRDGECRANWLMGHRRSPSMRTRPHQRTRCRRTPPRYHPRRRGVDMLSQGTSAQTGRLLLRLYRIRTLHTRQSLPRKHLMQIMLKASGLPRWPWYGE